MSKLVKPRRNAVVHVTGSTHLVGKKVIITPVTSSFPEDKWALHVDGHIIATCEYAKRLSEWAFAFDHGAAEVRHAYDLSLSDWEP